MTDPCIPGIIATHRLIVKLNLFPILIDVLPIWVPLPIIAQKRITDKFTDPCHCILHPNSMSDILESAITFMQSDCKFMSRKLQSRISDLGKVERDGNYLCIRRGSFGKYSLKIGRVLDV